MIRSKQHGFTLIELVVVIIILGILAAFAVPKFMGLETQARISAATAIQGSLESAASMAHGVAEATGHLAATDSITTPSGAITMAYGYPDASATGIQAALQDTNGYTLVTGTGTMKFEVKTASDPTNCLVTYTAATSATVPATTSTAVTTGC